MPRIHPFAALRPPTHLAASVAAPPYDVVPQEQAERIVEANSNSFLRVTLPGERDAAAEFAHMCDQGLLRADAEPHLYLYRMSVAGHEQTGVVGCVETRDYAEGRIRRHEHTTPGKVANRAGLMRSVGMLTGPVLLMHRGDPPEMRTGAELFDFEDENGVRHQGWLAEESETLAVSFALMDSFYVADGHHRSDAAVQAGAARFLAVVFPASQLRLLAYHRAVLDLKGQTAADLCEKLEASPASAPAPEGPGHATLYVDGRWWSFRLPGEGLDTQRLQEGVLARLLGVGDPRTDPRVVFVGGREALQELERRVDDGEASAAFALYPTRVEEVMEVADAGGVMPPKSTWFEPKLRSGLFVAPLT